MQLKGRTIDFFTAIDEFSLKQDTIPSSPKIGLDQSTDISNNVKKIKKIDINAIDSILRLSEDRERQIQAQKQQVFKRKTYKKKYDTTELYVKQFGIAGFPLKEKMDKDPFNQNIFLNFSNARGITHSADKVFIEEKQPEVGLKEKHIDSDISRKMQFDWVTFLFVGMLLLLVWVQVFNKKYLNTLFKSVVNYNESSTLFREKNSLTTKASFVLNILFVASVSLFALQVGDYLKIENSLSYINYLVLCGSFLAFVLLRFITSGFVGYVFLKQRVYSEYLYNANIYLKVTGLLLLPVIIVLQFVSYDYLNFVIYLGVGVVVFLYLMSVFRAVQIIIRNKVSIFYMILYLCAFEITPLLIVYKLLLSQG